MARSQADVPITGALRIALCPLTMACTHAEAGLATYHEADGLAGHGACEVCSVIPQEGRP